MRASFHESLIAHLKDVARTAQAPLLSYLEPLLRSGEVSDLRPLWISNVIGVTARPSVIYELTRFPQVRKIHLDLPREALGAPPSWSLSKIGADQVWVEPPSGYTGKNVTIAAIDSGVDPTVADLANRIWTNPDEVANGSDDDENGYADDLHGWDFVGDGSPDPTSCPVGTGDDDPNDCDLWSHGTAVGGILAGEDVPGASLRVGVAPGAKLIPLRTVPPNRQYTGPSVGRSGAGSQVGYEKARGPRE